MSVNILTDSEFRTAVKLLPLVSIDYLIINDNNELLLGLRKNSPAQGVWFTPGGRIFKNEIYTDAMHRIAMSELNLDLTNKHDCKFLGVFDHVYYDSYQSADVGTHYINLAYVLKLTLDLSSLPSSQHSQWKYFPISSIGDVGVHEYINDYLLKLVNLIII